jgi:hypothetical protein
MKAALGSDSSKTSMLSLAANGPETAVESIWGIMIFALLHSAKGIISPAPL